MVTSQPPPSSTKSALHNALHNTATLSRVFTQLLQQSHEVLCILWLQMKRE
jgi:hypothetical protein